MIKGVLHIGISTRDIKRLSHFYCEVLGFELVGEADWEPGTEFGDQIDRITGLNNTASKIAMVSNGSLKIEMFEYRLPPPKPKASDWQVCDHGYTHICLEVEDIEGEYERLRDAGMTFHAPPPKEFAKGLKAIYGRDPEGHVIEILEYAD